MGGDDLLPSRYISSIPGKSGSKIDYVDRQVSWKTTGTMGVLSTVPCGDFVQIQDQYGVASGDYDALRDRYHRENGRVRTPQKPILVCVVPKLNYFYLITFVLVICMIIFICRRTRTGSPAEEMS